MEDTIRQEDTVQQEEELMKYPAFIELTGITMESTHTGTREEEYIDNSGKKAKHTQDAWVCALKRENETMRVDYYTGLGHRQLSKAKYYSDRGFFPNRKDIQEFRYKASEAALLKICDPVKPKIEDVLDCLASDASSYDNARNFEDWCSDFGYDTDSRKAEKTYNLCAELAKDLKHFLDSHYDTLLYKVEKL